MTEASQGRESACRGRSGRRLEGREVPTWLGTLEMYARRVECGEPGRPYRL